ncbi:MULTISPECIES: hypothetical protein [Sphingopyxis]|jgi:hypothetical protein|uniref:Uncharacterized protein n=3 Tax=Sphingopyxis TaxID=165697 RepID=A0A0N7GRZ1_SPHMC|nr:MULTISPECIES: hypothetical protein [Sphingopyxis]MBN8845135.1 hypothetical protein [Sphingomonadales bacterium]ABF54220.1 hypothetical protein Sala_2513 [Sphingopyxis alaskensis RB2256]ALH79259.1 hypothetical protein AN936_02380 [Sphingopyxis macrogoltabida]MCM3418070.1 hypothetical protein [Sphingopyxis alaskensis]MDT7528175.1 hypothetical protein [Sphingopyxis sp. SE2]
MSSPRGSDPASGAGDWSGNWRTLVGLWAIPGLAMLAAMWLEPTPRAVIWTVMLASMGAACIMNARRCGRTHCRFTGPFLIGMAILVVAYAIGMLPLGPHGWGILGGVTLGGFAALWWGSERAWGKFSRSKDKGVSRSC